MAFRNEREGREKERKKEGNKRKKNMEGSQVSVIPSECGVMNYLAMPQDNQ